MDIVKDYFFRDLMVQLTSVRRYGQMTAGSYCYIGPQGIVHGTTVSGTLHVILRPYTKKEDERPLLLRSLPYRQNQQYCSGIQDSSKATHETHTRTMAPLTQGFGTT